VNVIVMARGLLILIAGLGSLAGARLSLHHLKLGEICPVIGPIPACYIVLLGYLCVLVAAIRPSKNGSKQLFYFGWTPVFMLAVAGVMLELTKGNICPKGLAGIPQCYISFVMAGLCWWLFFYVHRTRRRNQETDTQISRANGQ